MKKILLLDDNLDIVQIVEEVLAYEEYEVKSTLICTGFLQLAEQFCPDLIMLDYRLKDGNGGELCRNLKAHPKFGHIPVIIFTAYTQPGLDLLSYGCDAVIAKPFDLQHLIDTVIRLTRTNLFSDPFISESMLQGQAQEKQRQSYQQLKG